MSIKSVLGVVLVSLFAMSCQFGAIAGEPIVIYSNADEEAIEVIEKTLDDNGFAGEYIIQTFGTSELGGRLIAEGKDIEANLVTMSSYFIETAQNENNMFIPLELSVKALKKYPDYYSPILANTGAIFVNTEVLVDSKLDMPKTIKELADPKYKDVVSVPNIMGSSIGWLLIQAIINEYGVEEGTNILAGIIDNCGAHLENSGSGPIKKIRTGEVGVGFGLRHQAVKDSENGMPIKYIDPTEGNFSLTESLAVVNKDNESNAKALKMANLILAKGREGLIKYYPVALYEGEVVDESYKPKYSKVYKEPLTVKLLKEHQHLFKNAKNK